jgi:hypothetical protein
MLDTISKRTLFEHAASKHFAHCRNGREQNTQYVPFATHDTMQCFLQAAWMHLAWMSFEYEPAMESLKKVMASRLHFWVTPASINLDHKLCMNRKVELRDLYLHAKWETMEKQENSQYLSPKHGLDLVDVVLGVLMMIEICATCLIFGFFLWLLGWRA